MIADDDWRGATDVANDPKEPASKRPRLADDDRLRFGGERDPFMWSACRFGGERDPAAAAADVGEPRESGARDTQVETHAVASDFRALRRHDKGVRDRVVFEAAFRPWREILLSHEVGQMAGFTDDEIDEIWVWAIAIVQDEADPPVDIADFLCKLARRTLAGCMSRLRLTLARLLSMCISLPASGERAGHCPCVEDLLEVAIGLLSDDIPTEESAHMQYVRPFLMRSFEKKLAHGLFNPARKFSKPVGSVTLSSAFGIIIVYASRIPTSPS